MTGTLRRKKLDTVTSSIVWGLVADSNGNAGELADGTGGYDPALDITDPRILEYRNSHQTAALNYVTIAQDTLDYNNSTPTGIHPGSIGCMLTFLRDGQLPTLPSNKNLMVVANSINGTTSSYWMNGGSQAPSAVTRISQAVALDPNNTLGGIICCLGTNDANTGVSGATFTSNMQALVAYYRANVTGASASTPFVFIGLVPSPQYSGAGPTAIRSAIAALPSTISKSAAVDMTGVVGQTSINYHFTAASQRLIGYPGINNALANLSS